MDVLKFIVEKIEDSGVKDEAKKVYNKADSKLGVTRRTRKLFLTDKLDNLSSNVSDVSKVIDDLTEDICDAAIDTDDLRDRADKLLEGTGDVSDRIKGLEAGLKLLSKLVDQI